MLCQTARTHDCVHQAPAARLIEGGRKELAESHLSIPNASGKSPPPWDISFWGKPVSQVWAAMAIAFPALELTMRTVHRFCKLYTHRKLYKASTTFERNRHRQLSTLPPQILRTAAAVATIGTVCVHLALTARSVDHARNAQRELYNACKVYASPLHRQP